MWFQCTVKGGREGRDIGAYELAIAMEALGAGEILLNCIDEDGQGNGFDHELVNLVSDAVGIPVIASSGAGCPEHFTNVFNVTKCSGHPAPDEAMTGMPTASDTRFTSS